MMIISVSCFFFKTPDNMQFLIVLLAIACETTSAGAVLGKKYLGAWPLIIWEATTSRTTVSNCPVLSNLCTAITLKIWGAWARLGGCAPWPQPRTATAPQMLHRAQNSPAIYYTAHQYLSVRTKSIMDDGI